MADPTTDALIQLTKVFQNLQVTSHRGARSNDFFKGFQGSISGTTPFDVWTPSPNRYVLRGFSIAAIVRELLVTPGTIGAFQMAFIDSGSSTIVAPIGSYVNDSAQDAFITGPNGVPFTLDLQEGVRGSVLGSKLQITTGNDIGGGSIRFTGVVWGSEVTS
jgi:hypothetical protein